MGSFYKARQTGAKGANNVMENLQERRIPSEILRRNITVRVKKLTNYTLGNSTIFDNCLCFS